MKTLSDYTKILRDIASNLNLHGESVELLTQMLANALYISEVEHITFSQEASLERSSLENSKIQHCINQMYSVYRGANPRVLINFTASKFFEFNIYDEIIKSNNFSVYYLGYYNKKTGEVEYSPAVVTPDESESVTILGLLASSIYNSSWTVSDNVYYQSHPVSNLSSDLYLRDVKNDTLVDVTRIFSDHLRDNSFFDLTLPGYGCRIYYPEVYLETLRENFTNLQFELNVYEYLELSSISESELKSLKMNGATLQGFKSAILDSLNAKESYPGLVYISETSRDGIDTIHHKANKVRYTGTFMSTNSDFSFLLQEYYPDKIRTNGVTYRFITPPSTRIESVHKIHDLTQNFSTLTYLELSEEMSDTIDQRNYLPSGTLSFTYSKGNGLVSVGNISYDLILSSSIIPATLSGDVVTPNVSSVKVKVLKNNGGEVSLLSGSEITGEGLSILYQYSGSSKVSLAPDEDIPVFVKSDSGYNLSVFLIKSGIDGNVDVEVVPVVITPIASTSTITETKEDGTTETEVKETSVGNFYGLNLKDDTLYISTDYEGNFLTSPVTTNASFYYNGERIIDGSCRYSLIPVSDISAEINSSTGDIEIIGMSKNKEISSLIVTAEYNGNLLTEVMTVKKSISNLNNSEKPTPFSIYGKYGDHKELISDLIATPEDNVFEINVPKNTWQSIEIEKDPSIYINDGKFIYSYDIISNLVDSEEYKKVPSVEIYYIPYSTTNPLSGSEIDRFKEKNKSYYVTEDIDIKEGTLYNVRYDITLGLYSNAFLDESIKEILDRYSFQFNKNLGDKDNRTELFEEIESLITKIPEVKYVTEIEITYMEPNGNVVDYEKILPELDISYFDIDCNVFSIISPTNG